MNKTKKTRRSLKTDYYSSFILLVIVPVVAVLVVSLTVLNQVFKSQALENIRRAQEAVETELKADIEQISMRLSHMAYANNSEILALAARTDTEDYGARYQGYQLLNQAASYATEPVKDVISVAFYMKDGMRTFYKNDIMLTGEEIGQAFWYQSARENPNRVMIGSYNTNQTELYSGGAGDSLILVAALAPDVTLDREQKISVMALFQATGAAEQIKSYNAGYSQKRNRIGYTRIVDRDGAVVYEPDGVPEGIFSDSAYVQVNSPVEAAENGWYIESSIRKMELTSSYWAVAGALMLAMAAVLGFYALFSRYFLKRIIQPVLEISQGLRKVEEGELDVHLEPAGQYELRTMIHSFNAMVRRLRALIAEYEERTGKEAGTPERCLAALASREISPQEAAGRPGDFFKGPYVLMALTASRGRAGEEQKQRLLSGFETIPRFASRCTVTELGMGVFLVYYRAEGEADASGARELAARLRDFAKETADCLLFACAGRLEREPGRFWERLEEVLEFRDLYVLSGTGLVLDLESRGEECRKVAGRAKDYRRLALALYKADEKTVLEEKEALFLSMRSEGLKEAKDRVLSAVLETAREFIRADADFFDIFGQEIDYFKKIGRIEDLRSLRLWVTNYFSWIIEYSRNRLDMTGADAVTRAKSYLAEHYQEADLSLKRVAAYVDLSEKYFTTKFTKECGETFLSYLTALRLQKAKELIRTTTFKMYEIAEMVGYNNPEHFNRTFKKAEGVSPAQYRKNAKTEKDPLENLE